MMLSSYMDQRSGRTSTDSLMITIPSLAYNKWAEGMLGKQSNIDKTQHEKSNSSFFFVQMCLLFCLTTCQYHPPKAKLFCVHMFV